MADVLFLLQKAKNGLSGEKHVNGTQACIMFADAAQTLAQNNVTALAIMNTNEGGSSDVYPVDYFTSQLDITGAVPIGGILTGDVVYFSDYTVNKVGVA